MRQDNTILRLILLYRPDLIFVSYYFRTLSVIRLIRFTFLIPKLFHTRTYIHTKNILRRRPQNTYKSILETHSIHTTPPHQPLNSILIPGPSALNSQSPRKQKKSPSLPAPNKKKTFSIKLSRALGAHPYTTPLPQKCPNHRAGIAKNGVTLPRFHFSSYARVWSSGSLFLAAPFAPVFSV